MRVVNTVRGAVVKAGLKNRLPASVVDRFCATWPLTIRLISPAPWVDQAHLVDAEAGLDAQRDLLDAALEGEPFLVTLGLEVRRKGRDPARP